MRPIFALTMTYMAGLVLVYFNFLDGNQNLTAFVCLYAFTFAIKAPSRAVSPLSVFYVYYGLWFVLAPLFAERYEDMSSLPEYSLAFAMAYTVFGLGVIALVWGQRTASKDELALPQGADPLPVFRLKRWVMVLYGTSTLLVVLIVAVGGGLDKWISDPGDAFLTRAGSGIYVVLSHFSSMALATLSGYLAFRKRRMMPIVVFLAWVTVTSPVHGSKAQISFLTILLFLPWLRGLSIASMKSFVLYGSLIGIFFLGLYFRNLTWIETSTVIPYALNYFSALENLAMSVRDFSPQLLMTFFLPFVKFLTPFGVTDTSTYYDMNHLLTDIYFPTAWEIRATEQWPVETDLYLNFFFVGGLPLVAAYLFVIGAIYGRARKQNSLGAWFAAIVLTLFMVSHLRGSLINHTDFYMYPYIVVMYFLLRRVPIHRQQ
jgi:hypothetical protein